MRVTRAVVVGFAAMSLVSADRVVAAQPPRPQLIVHIDNFAAVPGDDLRSAEAEVRRIYATAGAVAVVVTGSGQLHDPGLHVRVQLLSREMELRRRKADRVADSAMGHASREAGYAYIFIHRIIDLTVRHSGDFRHVLGLVMAHEIGHLVLPASSHSDRGIMRANFAVQSKGLDGFTPAQGVAIRERLSAASRSQAAEPTDSAAH